MPVIAITTRRSLTLLDSAPDLQCRSLRAEPGPESRAPPSPRLWRLDSRGPKGLNSRGLREGLNSRDHSSLIEPNMLHHQMRMRGEQNTFDLHFVATTIHQPEGSCYARRQFHHKTLHCPRESSAVTEVKVSFVQLRQVLKRCLLCALFIVVRPTLDLQLSQIWTMPDNWRKSKRLQILMLSKKIPRYRVSASTYVACERRFLFHN